MYVDNRVGFGQRITFTYEIVLICKNSQIMRIPTNMQNE